MIKYQHQHKPPFMSLEIHNTHAPTIFFQSDIIKFILHFNHYIRHTSVHLTIGQTCASKV